MRKIETIIKLAVSANEDDWKIAYSMANALDHFTKLDLKHEIRHTTEQLNEKAKNELLRILR